MVAGVAYVDTLEAAYPPLAIKSKADEAADQARHEGLYVCTGGLLSASATVGKLDGTAGTDFVGTTERTYAAQNAQPCCLSATSTTVAAGSNGQHTNALTSAQLLVASTTGASAFLQAAILHAGVIVSLVSFTSVVDGSHLGGCALVAGWSDYVLVTGDTVTFVNNDITGYRWLLSEYDASSVYQQNAGTDVGSTTPVKPALTTARVLHGATLLTPTQNNTNALSIDEALTNPNGKSKLMQARRLVTVHTARLLYSDVALTSKTNPTLIGTSLLSPGYSLPAKSLSVGDSFRLTIGWVQKNTQNASTYTFPVTIGGSSFLINYTTPSMALDATNFRRGELEIDFTITAVGATGTATARARLTLSAASANAAVEVTTLGGGANADLVVQTLNASSIDTTGALAIDFQPFFGSSSTTATIALRHLALVKYPVQ